MLFIRFADLNLSLSGKRDAFSNICKQSYLLLLLPISSAGAERAFLPYM
jgi:hypothetical protein